MARKKKSRELYIDNCDAVLLRQYAKQAAEAFEKRNRAHNELHHLEEVSGVRAKRAEVLKYEQEERTALINMRFFIEKNVPSYPADAD